MKYLSLFFLFSCCLTFADGIQDQLQALQQIRTLIPERVWFQEFSILVDQKGFERQIETWNHSPKRQANLSSSYVIAEPKKLFLFATLCGENVRILDLYEQFEQSPFWNTPDMMDRLEWLEN